LPQRTCFSGMEPQPKATAALVLGSAIVAGLIVTLAYSINWQRLL